MLDPLVEQRVRLGRLAFQRKHLARSVDLRHTHQAGRWSVGYEKRREFEAVRYQEQNEP